MRVATFETPADLFAAFFGPEDHDSHVRKYRAHRWLEDATAASKRGCEAVDQFVADEREAQAQRVARDYNYNTASIRAALDRWTTGPFSAPAWRGIRAARIRQLTRALDIAIGRQAGDALATAIAAE